jgi:hypothetical protein
VSVSFPYPNYPTVWTTRKWARSQFPLRCMIDPLFTSRSIFEARDIPKTVGWIAAAWFGARGGTHDVHLCDQYNEERLQKYQVDEHDAANYRAIADGGRETRLNFGDALVGDTVRMMLRVSGRPGFRLSTCDAQPLNVDHWTARRMAFTNV